MAKPKNPKNVAAGKRARAKGLRWEQEINRALRVLFPAAKIWRGDQRRSGGSAPGEGCDNEGTPWWIEAKVGAVISVWAAFKQAAIKQSERDDERPVIIIAKLDKRQPVVVQPLHDWLDLVDERNTLRSASSWAKRHDWQQIMKPRKKGAKDGRSPVAAKGEPDTTS